MANKLQAKDDIFFRKELRIPVTKEYLDRKASMVCETIEDHVCQSVGSNAIKTSALSVKDFLLNTDQEFQLAKQRIKLRTTDLGYFFVNFCIILSDLLIAIHPVYLRINVYTY